mmetsp:Transcript_70061/g.130964  ORF Transcript_70061/g.130964 Transcript_70061/m.130964 type:complete len:264 (+) Transcript_70061:94-885(+)
MAQVVVDLHAEESEPEEAAESADVEESNANPAEEQQADGLAEASSTAEPPWPMTYGEQLIWEMTQKYKGRRYDRKRTEELARPRRRHLTQDYAVLLQSPRPATSSQSGETTSQSVGVMTPRRLEEMVERLSKPKKTRSELEPTVESLSLMPYGEALVLRAKAQEKSKRAGFDLQSMVTRLSSPRARRDVSDVPPLHVPLPSETRGQPPVNFARLFAMAKPTRRGASCSSWHITPGEVERIRGGERSVDEPPAPVEIEGDEQVK